MLPHLWPLLRWWVNIYVVFVIAVCGERQATAFETGLSRSVSCESFVYVGRVWRGVLHPQLFHLEYGKPTAIRVAVDGLNLLSQSYEHDLHKIDSEATTLLFACAVSRLVCRWRVAQHVCTNCAVQHSGRSRVSTTTAAMTSHAALRPGSHDRADRRASSWAHVRRLLTV